MRDKTAVLILSTMRSGSTLLKALLATAPDVSDLPEINFQKYRKPEKLNRLSAEPIMVLKRPAWFNETHSYPKLPPFPGLKKIVLVRDVYETVESLRKMVFRKAAGKLDGAGNRFLAGFYWRRVTENLLALTEAGDPDTLLVKYEELTADPIRQTARLFRFIGSEQAEGTDRYSPPSYEWKWGRDDGGKVIQTLRVRAPKPTTYINEVLLRVIRNSAGLAALRAQLGYPDI